MHGRQNTQTAFASAKFCYNVKTNQGCDGYYSHTTNNNRMRLCYNPIEPSIDNTVYCEATATYIVCDSVPPSPPSPPPPSPPGGAGRRMSTWDAMVEAFSELGEEGEPPTPRKPKAKADTEPLHESL